MANIKSQKKRIKTNEKNRQRNVAIRSRMKTYIKKAEDALTANDTEALKTALPKALSELDRAATKGVIHNKTASRKKSHLQRLGAKVS